MSTVKPGAPAAKDADVLRCLGVIPVVNARNWTSTLGGAPLDPRIVEAVVRVAEQSVEMPVLMERACAYVAELCGAEDAFLVPGAGAGITLAVAACMARDDVHAWRSLPRTQGLPNEVLMHHSHYQAYWAQWSAAGARIVQFGHGGGIGGALEDAEALLGPQTCCIGCTVSYNGSPRDLIDHRALAALADRHDIPVIFDTAAMLPPAANLRAFLQAGADLAIFSGGKALRALGSTGMLLARGRGVPLVRRLRRFAYPNDGWGRGFKLSKEQIVALVRGLEIFIEEDDERYARQLERAEAMRRGLANVLGLSLTVLPNDAHLHEHPYAPRVPRVLLQWSADRMGAGAAELDAYLRACTPAILLKERHYASYCSSDAWRVIDTHCLPEQHDAYVVASIAAFFSALRPRVAEAGS